MQEDQFKANFSYVVSLKLVLAAWDKDVKKNTVAYYLYEFKIVKYYGKQYGQTSEMWNGIIIRLNSPIYGYWQRKWSECVEE